MNAQLSAAAGADGPDGTSLAQSVAEHGRHQPEAPALVWQHEPVSYARLGGMAAAASDRLAFDALPPGPVGVVATKCPEAVAVVLACLGAGRPFLLLGPGLGTDARSTLLDDAGCAAVASVEAEDDAPSAPFVTHTVSPSDSTDRSARGASAPAPDETTFMLTTSGMTGPPAVVPFAARAVDAFTAWAAGTFGLGPGVRVLNHAPLHTSLCLLDVWATLRAGGCAVLVDPDRAADPTHLMDVLSCDEPHVVQGVPLLYELLVEATGGLGPTLEHVREVILTGGVLPTRTLQGLPTLFPAARLHNVYGSTETNASFVLELRPHHVAAAAVLRTPIGEPIPGVRALVVDERGDVVSGPGTGELWVHTPFQTAGYLGSAATAERFQRHVEDPDSPVYFLTGDIVERDEGGRITLLGRNDFQLNVGRDRINLLEVERTILHYAGVLEAAVIAVPDEAAPEALHAVVARSPQHEVDTEGLRRFCASQLPEAAVPSLFEVSEHPLPKTPTGRVDRRRIAEEVRRTAGQGGADDPPT